VLALLFDGARMLNKFLWASGVFWGSLGKSDLWPSAQRFGGMPTFDFFAPWRRCFRFLVEAQPIEPWPEVQRVPISNLHPRVPTPPNSGVSPAHNLAARDVRNANFESVTSYAECFPASCHVLAGNILLLTNQIQSCFDNYCLIMFSAYATKLPIHR